jgi:hypothetical protein
MNNALVSIKRLVIMFGLIVSSKFAMEADLKDLFKAIKNNGRKYLREFIKTNDVNLVDKKSHLTPLTCACFYDNYFAVKELIKAGANVNYKVPINDLVVGSNPTVLRIAAQYSRLAVVKELRENGADICESDNFSQECKPIADYLKEEKAKQHTR